MNFVRCDLKLIRSATHLVQRSEPVDKCESARPLVFSHEREQSTTKQACTSSERQIKYHFDQIVVESRNDRAPRGPIRGIH